MVVHDQQSLQPKNPIRIVVLGAGFGGVYTFKRLHKHFHGRGDVELILVSNNNYFLFTPLLHEVATGGIEPMHIVEPLRKELGCCMAEFHLADVCRINTAKKTVETTIGDIPYDYVISALGSRPCFFGVAGAEEHAFTLKTMSDAIRLKNHIITSVEQVTDRIKGFHPLEAEDVPPEDLLHFIVVGGGPTGVELAAEFADLCYRTFSKHYPSEIIEKMKVTIIHRGDELIPQFSSYISRKGLDVLRDKKVEVLLNSSVGEVTKDGVVLEDGTAIGSRSVIWTAGVEPVEVAFDVELQKERGKIKVNQYLQPNGNKNIFVIGDQAVHYDKDTNEPLPALAQVASKQGPYVADAVAAEIDQKKIKPFKYHHRGSLISLGRWRAAAQINKFQLYGRFTWWLWRTIYLHKLISLAKKIRVATDWTINIFLPRDVSQLTEIQHPNECGEGKNEDGA